MTEDEEKALRVRVSELEAEVKRLTTLATDRFYFMEAYRAMLGPIGREVAKMWKDRGVMRVHYSWGPDALAKSGEERAQLILDWEDAMKTAVLVESIDGDIAVSD